MDFIDEPKELNVRLNLDASQMQSKTTFFFKRLQDEEVIPIEDPQTAWDYYIRRRQDFKYVGQSDGKAFMEAVKEARQIFKEKGLEASQNRIREAIEAEKEIAKLNTTPPTEQDVFGNGAQYIRNNLKKYGN